jgi:hypothetical protein
MTIKKWEADRDPGDETDVDIDAYPPGFDTDPTSPGYVETDVFKAVAYYPPALPPEEFTVLDEQAFPQVSEGPVPPRHPSSARFHEILQELGDLHDAKSVGYGTDDDPLANCRASEKWGVPGWQGTMIRASDKVQRLQAYAQKGDLPFESIEDAFRDLAVYAVIALVLFEQERGR